MTLLETSHSLCTLFLGCNSFKYNFGINLLSCSIIIPSFYCCIYTELQKKPVEGFSAGLIDDDDIYEWDVMIIGPPDTF